VLLDFKSALTFPVNIVMYLGGTEERHPRHVHAWGGMSGLYGGALVRQTPHAHEFGCQVHSLILVNGIRAGRGSASGVASMQLGFRDGIVSPLLSQKEENAVA